MINYVVDIKNIQPLTEKGGEIFVLLSPKTVGTENLIMGRGVTPVGAIVKKHVHNYSEELFWVEQGEGVIYYSTGERVHFHAGMAVRVPKGIEHWIENTGSTDLIVTFASAPLAPRSKDGDKVTEK